MSDGYSNPATPPSSRENKPRTKAKGFGVGTTSGVGRMRGVRPGRLRGAGLGFGAVRRGRRAGRVRRRGAGCPANGANPAVSPLKGRSAAVGSRGARTSMMSVSSSSSGGGSGAAGSGSLGVDGVAGGTGTGSGTGAPPQKGGHGNGFSGGNEGVLPHWPKNHSTLPGAQNGCPVTSMKSPAIN